MQHSKGGNGKHVSFVRGRSAQSAVLQRPQPLQTSRTSEATNFSHPRSSSDVSGADTSRNRTFLSWQRRMLLELDASV